MPLHAHIGMNYGKTLLYCYCTFFCHVGITVGWVARYGMDDGKTLPLLRRTLFALLLGLRWDVRDNCKLRSYCGRCWYIAVLM